LFRKDSCTNPVSLLISPILYESQTKPEASRLDQFLDVFLAQYYHINRKIILRVFTLTGFHCILFPQITDVEQGGATVFPHLGISLRPIKAAAAFWYNLHLNGEGDEMTRHAACPVLKGTKWGKTLR